MRQRTSRKGRRFLAREEGVIRWAYADPLGFATFGIGHLIRRGPLRAEDFVKYGSRAHPATMRKVMRVFRSDLKPFEKAVRRAAGRRLPQHKFDALVSLAFNIGVGGFEGSTVARLLRERERGIGEAIRMWDNPAMLRARRDREVALFQRADYGG
jgi:lysozyme